MPIKDLQPGEPQDLWLDLGKPETRAVRSPLDVGMQARARGPRPRRPGRAPWLTRLSCGAAWAAGVSVELSRAAQWSPRPSPPPAVRRPEVGLKKRAARHSARRSSTRPRGAPAGAQLHARG